MIFGNVKEILNYLIKMSKLKEITRDNNFFKNWGKLRSFLIEANNPPPL
jgi:hypothetical protein